MAAERCARVRLWRWRRSPLRRRSDLAEAWVIVFAWVFALVGALLAGQAAAASVAESAADQRARSVRVSAVLVEDATDPSASRVTTDHRVWSTVRWTAPDGTTRTDEARVPPKTPAGSEVTVWTDGSGVITSEPLSAGETRLHSVAGGVLAAACAGGAVLGMAWVVRQGIERRRLTQWAEEWEQIDTPWGWKTG
jgi:hypothetical protein